MAKAKAKPRTAKELMEELRNSGRYEAFRKAQQDKELRHEQQVREHHRLLGPLLDDLRRVGVPALGAILTGMDTKVAPYPAAIPILLDHLRRDYGPDQRIFIAAALQAPEA